MNIPAGAKRGGGGGGETVRVVSEERWGSVDPI